MRHSHPSSHHSKGYYIGLFLLLLILGWYGHSYYKYVANDKTADEQYNQIKTGDTGGNVEDIKTDTDLYGYISEKDFKAFAENTIEKRCPYYEPNGAEYRTCLSEWEEQLAAKLIPEQVDEVRAYCSGFTTKYAEEGTLLYAELFLKCSIYKLQ